MQSTSDSRRGLECRGALRPEKDLQEEAIEKPKNTLCLPENSVRMLFNPVACALSKWECSVVDKSGGLAGEPL